ncbi:hypothetical protein QP119_02245 [Corynebacterium frankenforstense]|uniref:hypothetical protein n=1 Tax=Corynebacterium TaxID=1716 RepID=UPI002549CB17|nr:MULTISPECIES: hypothetical protein [Corynebacterium]MDK6259253.1 hypothetical protein [Corynebacterium frankenforstense]MDK8894475.1 hypothetical protein [Corynebacterium sp. MSK006]
MTSVSGDVVDVTASPSLVVSVWVRARSARPHSDGLVTVENHTVAVDGGRIVFDSLPGPAAQVLTYGGAPSEVVPLVVPEGGLGDAGGVC